MVSDPMILKTGFFDSFVSTHGAFERFEERMIVALVPIQHTCRTGGVVTVGSIATN